jgi:hypothetical protein
MRQRENNIFWSRHRRRQRTCVCIECGEMARHKTGNPCGEEKCPVCGAYMVRIGSYRFRQWQKERKLNHEKQPFAEVFG